MLLYSARGVLAYVNWPRARGAVGPSTSTERTLTLIAFVVLQQPRYGPVAVFARGQHHAAHAVLRSSASPPLQSTTFRSRCHCHCHCRGPHTRQQCHFENGIGRRQPRSITVPLWRLSSCLRTFTPRCSIIQVHSAPSARRSRPRCACFDRGARRCWSPTVYYESVTGRGRANAARVTSSRRRGDATMCASLINFNFVFGRRCHSN